ncbi:MAG: ABC transporter ATP-binding protein [Candidatus Altiarchaeota archaeon]
MPAIEVKGLSKTFGGNRVLKDISFKVEDGEYVMVLGPSGCGKTTLLKVLAGLYHSDDGNVLIDGVDVTSKRPEERNIGFFFQHYSLFPHMTVRQNVGYSLNVRGVDENEIRKTVDEKLKLVGLSKWSDHLPYELSGGMQQRVALARVLAKGSKLLLLDEPLNALDAKIATLLRRELNKMADDMALTVIHVTPNQEEAMELGDKIILMNDGRIVQIGDDVEVYTQPNTPYAAYFIGESNFLRASRAGPHLVRYRHHLFAVKNEVQEDDVILAIRSEKIRFEHHDRNTLEGVIEAANFLGRATRYEVNNKGRHIHVETSKYDLKVGDAVHVYFPPEDLMVYPAGEQIEDEITVI